MSKDLDLILTPVVEGLGYELVGIEYHPQGSHSLLRIYIDQQDGIGISDCEKVSRQISAVLDVEDPIKGEYRLEVSSPGMDRPLFSAKQFEQFIGHKCKIRLHNPIEGQKRFVGFIDAVKDDQIKLLLDKETSIEFSMDELDKANLVPEF